MQDYEHRCATYYKAGVGVDVLDIETALKHYNEKNGTNLKWYGCEWWLDRYMPERNNYYKYYCDLYGKLDVDAMIEKVGGYLPEEVKSRMIKY